MLVAEDLDFDVARLLDEFFDEDAVVAEAVGGFVLGGLEPLARFNVVIGDAHALAAAARGRLDHHGIADLVRDFDGFFGVLDQAHVAGNAGHARLGRQFLGGDLIPHRGDGVRVRADESDAFGF